MSRIRVGDLVIAHFAPDGPGKIGTVIALPPLSQGMWDLVRVRNLKGGPTYRYMNELTVLWSPRKIAEFLE